jgi:monoamine oxidase
MSRSYAMRRIWRALQRWVSETQPGTHLFSRRDMLKASGMALGGLLLSGRSSAQAWRAATAPSIGIVGAGIAGLTAALTLQDNGLLCSIYEASRRIGGRMHSNHNFWPEGQTSEWCGEFIDSDHIIVRRLAKRFGLTLSDVVAAEPPYSQDTNYFLGGYYTDAELARDLSQIAPILAEQNQEIGPVVFYNYYTPTGYYFDHISAREWIETYVPGGLGSRLGLYLNVATVTENGLDTSEQSALNLIFPLVSDERYHIKNGNEQLPTLIAKSLPAGTIQRGWRMTTIVANDNQTVTLTFETSSGTQSATFDYVILALPFSVLRTLDFTQANFDTLKQRSIKELGYGTNSKLILQFDDRYWNGRGAWPGVSDGFIQTDLSFQSTWDSSRAEPGKNGLLTDYTGGTPGAAFRPSGPYTTSRSSAITAGYANSFLEQLEVVWPGISSHYNGLATLSYPTGDPNLRGSYSTYKVGQYTGFADYQKMPQGRIHFAGEHTSYLYQGFMEGGAASGTRAAQEILAVL